MMATSISRRMALPKERSWQLFPNSTDRVGRQSSAPASCDLSKSERTESTHLTGARRDFHKLSQSRHLGSVGALAPISPGKRYDSIGSAPEREPEHGWEIRAGALSIGAFERGRWRLRRTRHLWVFNRLGDVWDCQFAAGTGRECIALHREPWHQRAWKFAWGAFGFE
jgi:hypothetical protein